ncbi:MAG: XdhC family protein [Thermoleophilia bacterium]
MLDVYQSLKDVLAKNEPAVMVTIVETRGSVPRKAGARMLVKQDGSTVGTVGGGSVEHAIKARAMTIIREWWRSR